MPIWDEDEAIYHIGLCHGFIDSALFRRQLSDRTVQGLLEQLQ